MELKGTGITSTAVCPSWVDTDLLMKEFKGKKIKFPGIVTADKVAVKALRDAKRGKDILCEIFAYAYKIITSKSDYEYMGS